MNITDITCRRSSQGYAIVEGVAHELVCHSPTGFEWGYLGSGPAELALNILYKATGDKPFAKRHYQRFKEQWVSTLPLQGGVISARTIRAWIHKHRAC